MAAFRSLACLAVSAALFSVPATAAPDRVLTRVERAADIRNELGLNDALLRSSRLGAVKIAILDAGFAGVENEIRTGKGPRFLPKTTELIENYGNANLPGLDPTDSHGLHLAQIVWAMTGYSEDGPQFRLYNANGPENFVEAVRHLVRWQADIVLCSRNWETFGNFDGKGFVNKAVEEATDEGILWFQAAGNYHQKVFNGPVRLRKHTLPGEGESDWVALPHANTYVRFKNLVDENNVTITLSWNDFHPGPEPRGTTKDLDLYLYRQKESNGPLEVVASSRLRQVASDPNDGETLFPRERIVKKLRASGDQDYWIGIRRVGGDFDGEKDRIRITVTGDKQPFVDKKTQKRLDPIDFLDATNDGEIMVPADNRSVITVGDFSPQSAKGPTVDGRGKPEILFPRSNVNFTDRNAYYGTSYAAAYMAAIAVVLKGREPLLSRAHLLRFRTADPQAVLQANGWNPEAPWRSLWENEHVVSKFGSLLRWNRVAVRTNLDGHPTLGFLDRFSEHHFFSNLPENVRKQPKDYNIFVSADLTPTVRTVQDPPKTARLPDRRVMVEEGKYVSRSDILGYLTYGNVPLYAVYQNRLDYVPPRYETVPGKTYQVPGEYRQVPGDPIVTLRLHHRSRAGGGTPLPFESDERRHPRTNFLRVEEVELATTEGRGKVVDGSEKSPKLWRTPGLLELRTVVEGRE
jgi:hypothetical protein